MFVGVDAYEAAGGTVTRDLFEQDDGGWLQDPALLDRLVIDKLEAEAEKLRTEGWRWISAAPDFPYGHTAGFRRLDGHAVDLTEEEIATRHALEAELEGLEQQYMDAEEVPEQVDRRLGEIETALEALNDRPVVYDPAEIAFAGAFVSIDRNGSLRIERGYVRSEDEPPVEPVQATDQEAPPTVSLAARPSAESSASASAVRRSRRPKAKKRTASSRCRNGSSPS
jgi:ParB family chromosome partitioning protein